MNTASYTYGTGQDQARDDSSDQVQDVVSGIDTNSTKDKSKTYKRLFDLKEVVDSSNQIMANMMKEMEPDEYFLRVNKTKGLLASKDAIKQALNAGFSAKQVAQQLTARGLFPVSAKLITQLFLSKAKLSAKKARTRTAVETPYRPPPSPAYSKEYGYDRSGDNFE
jgi:hypothetical protein